MTVKILLANKFFYPQGGAETVFFQERDFLLANGHEVVDFAMDHPANLPSPHAGHFVPHVDYHRQTEGNCFQRLLTSAGIAADFVHNSRAIRNIEELIAAERPQLAHLHNIYHQITPSVIPVLHRLGIKIALTLHDYKIVCPNYLMLTHGRICSKCRGKAFWHAAANKCQQESWAGSLLLAVEAYWHRYRRSYGKVDLFIAPSRFMAETVAQSGIPPDRIRILHNGIDPENLAPTGEDKGYALYFGRLSREKGVATFLAAHARLEGRIKARVVGSGPLAAGLAKDHPLVEFTGFLQGEELRNAIQRASFIVVPSEWYENCSMTVLEAMAAGKPVIGSRIGGIPEQVEDDSTGFLFQMGNVDDLATKMARLADDATLRRKMGESGRKRLEQNFSLDRHNRQLLEIYRELLT